MRATLVIPALAAFAACQDNATPLDGAELPPPIACLPDRDGVLTADELPIALDGTATYHASPAGQTRAVDLAGADEDGTRVWDLDAEDPGDELVEVGATALGAQWYATAFAGGGFVTPQGPGIDAVYHLDATGLWLHGLASTAEEPAADRTLLVYDAPVPVLRLPLRDGDAWTATGTVSGGTLDGLPYVGADTYTVAADGAGRLDLPYVRFAPVLRVETLVEVEPAAGGVMTSRRQTLFLFECFGELARAESRADEPAEEFTTASYLRRFAL